MILAALLSAPALAQPLPGAEKMGFADLSGWWLAAPGAAPRPAAISLHRCDGLHPRNEPDARERAMAESLRDPCGGRLLSRRGAVRIPEHELR
jgi:hypothetical protein